MFPTSNHLVIIYNFANNKNNKKFNGILIQDKCVPVSIN